MKLDKPAPRSKVKVLIQNMLGSKIVPGENTYFYVYGATAKKVAAVCKRAIAAAEKS